MARAGSRATAGLKVRATETAKTVVDQMVRVAGGSSYFAGNELGRLYRDVLAGIFHPSDDESAHSTVAQSLLGPPLTTPPDAEQVVLARPGRRTSQDGLLGRP